MSDDERELPVKGLGPDEMEDRDVKLLDLLREDEEGARVAMWFARLAGLCLRGAGSVTFFLDDNQHIRWANPVHVYLDSKAVVDELPSGSFRWVRPVIGEGKPQFVAWKNSQLWEVEFTDDPESESEKDTGGEDH